MKLYRDKIDFWMHMTFGFLWVLMASWGSKLMVHAVATSGPVPCVCFGILFTTVFAFGHFAYAFKVKNGR